MAVGPSKHWVTWGGLSNYLLEKGDKPEMKVNVEMGGGGEG